MAPTESRWPPKIAHFTNRGRGFRAFVHKIVQQRRSCQPTWLIQLSNRRKASSRRLQRYDFPENFLALGSSDAPLLPRYLRLLNFIKSGFQAQASFPTHRWMIPGSTHMLVCVVGHDAALSMYSYGSRKSALNVIRCRHTLRVPVPVMH